jgi:hypothetical protein
MPAKSRVGTRSAIVNPSALRRTRHDHDGPRKVPGTPDQRLDLRHVEQLIAVLDERPKFPPEALVSAAHFFPPLGARTFRTII